MIEFKTSQSDWRRLRFISVATLSAALPSLALAQPVPAPSTPAAAPNATAVAPAPPAAVPEPVTPTPSATVPALSVGPGPSVPPSVPVAPSATVNAQSSAPAVPPTTVPGQVVPGEPPMVPPSAATGTDSTDLGSLQGDAAVPQAADTPAGADGLLIDPDSIDLDALLGDDSDAGAAGVDTYSINIFGFADFSYLKGLDDNSSITTKGFAVGNLNVYLNADLGDGWRSLSEVRFTYLPHGSVAPTAFGEEPTRTTVGDYTDYSRPLNWGGIEIERAWVEYRFNNWATVRAGSWLTPYGIWNVDHGSPVILGTVRPFIVGEQLFPERQTGLNVYGTTQIGATELGYFVTASNGRGPFDAFNDLDDSLAFGGRLYARYDGDYGLLAAGLSAYTGRYTDSFSAFELQGTEFIEVEDVTNQYDETSLAADLKYEYEGFLVQGEVIMNTWTYTDAGRPVAFVFDGTEPGFNPDQQRWGVYGIAGYRTPWLNATPWVGMETYDGGVLSFFGQSTALFVGLNLRPTPRVVLKLQYTHPWFPDTGGFSDGSNLLVSQAAWSF